MSEGISVFFPAYNDEASIAGLVGEALAVLTSAGGVTIIGIALKLLDVRDVKVGNFLPALVVAPLLVGLVALVRP